MARDKKSSDTGNKIEARQHLNELRTLMGTMQRMARDKGVPIVIIFEGWDTWGLPEKVNRFIRTLDPRGYNLYFVNNSHQKEINHPFICSYYKEMPASGSIAVFDRSWYFRLVDDYYDTDKKEDFESRLKEIRMMEEQHARHGCVFVKFFLNLGKKELRKRVEKGERKDLCRGQIDPDDDFSEDYSQVLPIWEHVLSNTNFPFAPWTVLKDDDEGTVMQQIFHRVLEAVQPSLENDQRRWIFPSTMMEPEKLDAIVLDDVDLTKKLEESEYREKLGQLQKRVAMLQCELRKRNRALIIVFEGWDAAGKGGSIIRLTNELNPRGYKVVPIGPPNDLERQHHYLWRFYKAFPCFGEIAIFDRSWYGRVLVERVEKLTKDDAWQEAYGEIRDMERMLTRSGYIIIKFWLHMDEETQLMRFQERGKDPDKQWKITDEDWRNRGHWEDYKKAVEDMLSRTGTEDEPWIVVPSNDKYYSRVLVLQSVIERLENELE
jgi:polyphosphate:AMP phosphotransferase